MKKKTVGILAGSIGIVGIGVVVWWLLNRSSGFWDIIANCHDSIEIVYR